MQICGHFRAAVLLRLDTVHTGRLFGVLVFISVVQFILQLPVLADAAIIVQAARTIRWILKFQLTIARVLSDNQARWLAGWLPSCLACRGSLRQCRPRHPARITSGANSCVPEYECM
jgi:hypothetical protein